MTKIRFEKADDDQDYYVYLGLNGPIGRVVKMDDNRWHARHSATKLRRSFDSRGEAAEWFRTVEMAK